MKLKYEMSYLEIDGQPMAVPMNAEDDGRCVINMNETALFITKMLENEVSEDEIVDALKKEYDATEEKLRENVKKIVNILRENSLLTE